MADRAREQTLPRFRADVAIHDKGVGGFDPVTEGDREAERVMRELLADTVPDHNIIGEEHGATDGPGPWTWVLDPIDGTRAFMAGFPSWVTLIGLMFEGVPVMGLIDAPATDDRWVGGPGIRPPRRVRACASLDQAVLTTTDAELFSGQAQAAWLALCAGSRLRRYGGDGYGYGLLSAGHLDAVVERGMQIYDVAAPIAVVRGAGGIVTGWDGGDPLRGHMVASGDERLHAQILEVLRAHGATG